MTGADAWAGVGWGAGGVTWAAAWPGGVGGGVCFPLK